MNRVNTDYEGDPEYECFEEYVDSSTCAKATAKSYRTTYRKLRNLLQKPIRETAEDTLIKIITAAVENINSQQAMLNIAIIVRECIYNMPTQQLKDQRTLNKSTVKESLQMRNKYIVLPEITEFDDYIEDLFNKSKFREFIVNYLIRHHYVRNKDLMFHIVEKKSECDNIANWMWLDRKNRRCVYFRNDYKTFCTYGPKETVITDEKFLTAVKRCFNSKVQDVESRFFPITMDPTKIGYYVQKLSFNQLGESALLKIIIKHHLTDYKKIQEISISRGTDTNTLLESYNISYK